MKEEERYDELEEEQKALGGFTDADADEAMYESEINANEKLVDLFKKHVESAINNDCVTKEVYLRLGYSLEDIERLKKAEQKDKDKQFLSSLILKDGALISSYLNKCKSNNKRMKQEKKEGKVLIQSQLSGDVCVSLDNSNAMFNGLHISSSTYIPRTSVKIVNESKNKLPEIADIGSAGCDLRANLPKGNVILKPREKVLISTGLHIQLPIGLEAQVRSRSGLTLKHGIIVLNGVGTIDSTYTGDIGVILYNTSDEVFVIDNGDRIAQLVIAPYTLPSWCPVTELDKTERGDGGFGHSGIK